MAGGTPAPQEDGFEYPEGMSVPDEAWMRRALELAERGRGHVEPNPLVGAVVVRDGQVVGEGWHQRYGEAHAEVNALAAAGDGRPRRRPSTSPWSRAATTARRPPAPTPCCAPASAAWWPPCPTPSRRSPARGQSCCARPASTVEFGLCEAEARRLNAPYLKLLATGRPYVHAKWAMTLDGKIATRTGDSKWISNEASRRRVHELRGRMDAIVVGIGTALADDPQLTARPPGPRTRRPRRPRQPRPAAADVPAGRRTRATSGPGRHGRGRRPRRRAALRRLGCEVLRLPAPMAGADVDALLAELGRRRYDQRAGRGRRRRAGQLPRRRRHRRGPRLHRPGPGRRREAALAPVGGRGVEKIAEALRLSAWRFEDVAGDLYVRGWK